MPCFLQKACPYGLHGQEAGQEYELFKKREALEQITGLKVQGGVGQVFGVKGA